MELGLTNTELVKAVRGDRTQQQFGDLVGLAQCVISSYERGAVIPSSQTWRKLGDIAHWPHNIFCWQRAGLSREVITELLEAMESGAEAAAKFSRRPDPPEAVERMRRELIPEPATEPLGDEPVGGLPESLKKPVETIEQFYAQNPVHPPAQPVIDKKAPDSKPGVRQGKGKANSRRKR